MLQETPKFTSSCCPSKEPSQDVSGANPVVQCPALWADLKALIMWDNLYIYKLRSSSSIPSALQVQKAPSAQLAWDFSLAQLSVEICVTADKSSVEMPYNAALMVEELSPNCHSRDFPVVSAPMKDWLGRGKTVIPIQGGNAEQEEDSIQYSPLLNVDIAADWKNRWLFLWEYIPGSILRSRAKMN